jgi:glycosyltransferase involved in cell wall biosynthesis/SAM-dependent methyltransferase
MKKLGQHAEVSVFDESTHGRFEHARYDIPLYHIGNNPWHAFAYETALRHPGVVAMHEGNLHHLIADLTIKRGDWQAYLDECELNGGPEALAFARDRVRTLLAGPDYEGVPMTRRLLDSARGVVVHSRFVANQMRQQGYAGPVAVIPHGAWLPQTDRNSTRELLGLDESTPLIGAFGFIKPYKRIAESLRALRRLVKVDPRVKMILAGEPHPEFPVDQLIKTLGLRDHVRVLGFVPTDKFVDYMGACDIILNLRYPTVGETSGSLQRALGLGKAVIVSDIGSFAELPDDVCLKVPAGPDVGTQEEDLLFEYLNLLVSRPDLAQAMGQRAKDWVARECNWAVVANRYVEFLEQVVAGTAPTDRFIETAAPKPAESLPATPFADQTESEVVENLVEPWVVPQAVSYAKQHTSRFFQTLSLVPPGAPEKSVLEMGAYMQITPALKFELGYGCVRGCYYGPAGRIDRRHMVSSNGEEFECLVDHFDAERDPFPYADNSFDTVLCCELIEHLTADPMHMMSEINRILKPGGYLLLTTPNIGSLRAISALLMGYHPAFFPAYIRARQEGEEAEARHNREYVPREIGQLFADSGLEVVRLETGEFLQEPHPEFLWVKDILKRYRVAEDLRGDGIYALGRKTGPVKDRWPEWLYS